MFQHPTLSKKHEPTTYTADFPTLPVFFAKKIKTCTAVASELWAKRVEVGSLSVYPTIGKGFEGVPDAPYMEYLSTLGQVKNGYMNKGEMAVGKYSHAVEHMENVLKYNFIPD